MVKSYLTILLLAFGFWSLQAQCPTGDVTLTSQAEVDAFAATYPNCTTITGHLIIQGADITDLSGLSSLTSILGLLSIGDNASLMDLDGLSGITSIFDGLDILFNASLTDLNGLSALTSVGGALNIVSNASLTDISGLSSVNSIGGVLNITDNDVLTNLNGLSGITSITGVVMIITDNDVLTDISGLENIDATTITQLFIQNNPQLANCAIMSICDYLSIAMSTATITGNDTGCATREEVELSCLPSCPEGAVVLTSQAEVDAFAATYPNCTTIMGNLTIVGDDITNLSGLSGVNSISGGLGIASNDVLTDLSGLSALSSIGDYLLIFNNDVLTDLNGLTTLTSIAGELSILSNAGLTDISGLENIDATTITQLFIGNNPQLANCAIRSICDYLGVEMNAATISDNATGCATRMEVETACTPTCPTGDVFLSSQAEVDAFVATYPNCTEITGNMRIGVFAGSTDITDISGLSSLTSIGGSLRIGENAGLMSMTGLDNLASIGGFLEIADNAGLTSMTGLDNLASIGGYLNISYNAGLMSMTGLDNLASISGDVFISFNVGLTSMMGLDNLASIGGFLDIRFNVGLTSMTGLDNLASIGGYLRIRDNVGLTSMTGLDNLASIGGFLEIQFNAGLTSMTGLENLTSIDGDLRIRFNDVLTNLTGLEQLDATTITELTIQGNPQLSTCAIESICGYLGVAMNAASISDNATGCTTRMEVEMACTAAPAGDLCTTAFDVNPLLGQGINQPQISTLLDNTDNAASDTPAAGFECHFEMDTITNSLWVSFMGDGNTYRFTTITCSADSSFLNDTQMALYSGTCDNLTPVTCNEDEDEANSLFNAEINQFTTLDGTAYFLLLDGYGGSTGEFCLEVTQQITVSTTDISQTNIELFPNPTNGRLQLRNITAEHVDVFTSQGQRVARYDNPGQELDLSALPAGVYHLHLIAADGAYVAKVVKR